MALEADEPSGSIFGEKNRHKIARDLLNDFA
jgi:hypothetical protein